MSNKIDGGLRSLFREHLPKFDWQSIESGLTGGGIPDANFCLGGVEGWVEFKRTPGWTVPLAPEQIGWIARRVRAGGRVWVAVRQQAARGPRREAVDALWLVPGAMAKEARIGGLRPLANAHNRGVRCHRGGVARWDWVSVGRTLVS